MWYTWDLSHQVWYIWDFVPSSVVHLGFVPSYRKCPMVQWDGINGDWTCMTFPAAWMCGQSYASNTQGVLESSCR